MKLVPFGKTDLTVSNLCLGTMQFGWTADEAASFEMMDAYVAAGGNFIDTADIYRRWAPGNPGGVSEEIIGRWMKARGNRDSLVVATKLRGQRWDGPDADSLEDFDGNCGNGLGYYRVLAIMDYDCMANRGGPYDAPQDWDVCGVNHRYVSGSGYSGC